MKTRLAVLLVSFATLARADAPSSPVAAPDAAAGRYNLFVGADLLLVRGKEALPILDALGHSRFVVRAGTEKREYNLRDARSIQARPALKLSRHSATISNLETERDYSPGNSPQEQAARIMIAVDDMRANARDAAFRQAAMFNTTGFDDPRGRSAESAARNRVGAAPGANSMGEVGPSANFIDSAGALAMNPLDAGASATNRAALNASQFDSVRIEFDLYADRRIEDPYIAIVADVTDPTRPGEQLSWIYVRALDALSPSVPRRVRVYESGFPRGFEIKRPTVHLYSRAEEFATNLSERRTSLTRDEAFTYVLLQHLGAHKGETNPPALLWTDLPRDFRAHVTPDVLDRPMYLQIGTDGHPMRATWDAEGQQPLDDYLHAVVTHFRFAPALVRGKPVAQTLAFTLRRVLD